MSKYRKFTLVCCAAVLALGLAACGSSSDNDKSSGPGAETPDPAIAERGAINGAITTASTAVTGLTDDASDTAIGAADSAVAAAKKAIADAANVPASEKAAFNTAITAIEGSLTAKKTSIMAARGDAADALKADMAKTGKAMHAALGSPTAAYTTALSNAAVTLLATGLEVDAAMGAGSLPDTDDGSSPASVTLKAGDDAMALGSWNGTHYSHTNAGTKMVNAAVVYNNKGTPKSVSFAAAGHAVVATGVNKGYLTDVLPANVMGTAFAHSGLQNHPIPTKSDAFYTRGTYDGAPGEYRCTGICSSTNDGKGSPSELDGTWHFKPDTGAMVSKPDTTYLYYGWWVSKDKDGAPTAASAFTGVIADDQAALRSVPGENLTGGATYAGHAAGKFAMSNPLDGTGDGGHFTADATLTAKFGDGVDAGMTGMIDNFMANDKFVPWSVELKRGAWGDDGAIAAPGSDEAVATVWSIDGNKAPTSGIWSGQMYDEMPGNAPNGDGSNVPTTVTGTFYSEFSTIGRMVGAFGANKQ